MASSNKTKRRKGLISEEDTASLLKRYSAQTILTLLREIAQFADVKIDWNLLVKKTNTGISNAREYQMLWRHLAYCQVLPETVDEKLEPLDDDSDLEYELEVFPPVSDEAALEAAACVKVVLASGLSDGAGGPATVEAPLAINIPSWQDYRSASDNPQTSSSKGINITVPVSVQKQSAAPAVTTAEGLDGTGTNVGGQPAKRKRKPWTLEEDNQLIAAVKKLGKSNWSNILKANFFKGDRTASQLSQRWSYISKKPNVNSETGGGSGNQSGLAEQQLAANRAVSFALDKPMNNNLSAASVPMNNNLSAARAIGLLNSTKPRVTTKKAASVVPNPMVQAAALAAGARIASPSTAKSLLKAAQSKSAVHISNTGKSSMPSATPPSRPYVHYICPGWSSASPATYSTVVPSVSLLPPPPPPAMKGKRTIRDENLGKDEKVQSSSKEVVKNSPKEVVKNSSDDEEVKNSSKEELVEPEGMEIDCSADTAKNSKQNDQAAFPDSDMDTEDQATQNLSKLPHVEAAVSDPMQLDNHQIKNEKEKMKFVPRAGNSRGFARYGY
ncbi:hypothetical protein MKW94_030225 [Papaver nudicaule]|uniref:Uncharacterized protein n=1 Tax=Papaver nudicaule TaxID=74823 RepID=A0AA41V894_PAPNU|nr:hypothetical protein [Papaver nudicaule]